MAEFNWDEHPIVASASGGPAKEFNWDDHPISTPAPPQSDAPPSEYTGGGKYGAPLAGSTNKPSDGSKNNPFVSDIFGSEGQRARASFGDTKGVGKMLGDKYVNVDKNDNGDLVVQDHEGKWHRDASDFSTNPLNFAASSAGKSIPTGAAIGAGLLGIESGPGALAAAAAAGAGGEAVRSSIGRGMGVYAGDAGDQALDALKEGGTMAAAEGVGRYALHPALKAITPDLEAAGQAVGRGAARAGEALTGVPQQEIKTYFQHGPEVDQLARENDYNPERMAAKTKQAIGEKVNDYRTGANNQIQTAIDAAPNDKEIDVSPVVARLQAARDKLAQNPNMNKEAISDIDELLSRIQDPMLKKNNVAVGYVAPNEKAATISTKMAEGGPQKTIQLHEFGEPVFPDKGDPNWIHETPSEIPGQTGQRTVPVTEDSSGPGDPRWAQLDPNTLEPGRNQPIDSTVEFPIGKQTLQNGDVSTGKPQYLADLGGLNEIKKFLQDQAKPAYGSTPLGFKVGDAGANEAKGAAAVARGLMDDAAGTSPEAQRIMDANKNLSSLHDIEDRVSRNVLDEDKTGAGLFAAGSGNNMHNANALEDLGKLTGNDFLGDAQKLAAARTFGRPQLMPKSGQGTTSTSRSLLASGLGGLVGSVFGPVGAVAGAAAGNVASSPAALKLAVNAARAGTNVSRYIAEQPFFQSFVKNPQLVATVVNPTLRKMISQALSDAGMDHEKETVQYNPAGEKTQPQELAKQLFLQGN